MAHWVVGTRIGPKADQLLEAGKHNFPVFVLLPAAEKVLDDTEALLYCEPKFDRQFAISLS